MRYPSYVSFLGARVGAYIGALLVTVLVAISFAATSAVAAAPLTRGFADDVWFTAGPEWVQRTAVTGARMVLLEVNWAGVEPSAPAPFVDPSSPNAPQYSFADLDARVRRFAGSGLSVGLLITNAPRWAEAPGGPANLEAAGAWRPNAAAFGQLAAAIAGRYSGSFPDPLRPAQQLPRVRYYQAWAEPNFSVHLAPQWSGSGRGAVPLGPGIYRGMLNAFYAGIKRVHFDNSVITAGFGPFGDAPGGSRMPPAQFVRELLCLHGRGLVPGQCPDPAHFDTVAMDPYEIGSPTTRAYNADDVTAPDIGKLTRIVNKAVRLGRALPRRHKKLWVTEFSYDSNPPNPTAVSLATQARWLEESLYLFWNQGVDTVFWYLVRDQGGTNYNTSYFSGVYFYGGQRKPAFEAYRFPLVVMPSGRRATVWGIAPQTGNVAVQRQQGHSWRALFTVHASAGGVFARSVSARLRGNFRAVVNGESSLAWQR